ncbi:hypothetical protein GTY54_31170, partial [Streptomyces sp. SID625]|nr:hypothetical protein [Streptomyces sp. SID625]
AGCVRGRTPVTFAAFARLAGDGLRVVAAPGTEVLPGPAGAGPVPAPGGPGSQSVPGMPELVAEAALLQARLDWFQTRLALLGERGPGGAGQG